MLRAILWNFNTMITFINYFLVHSPNFMTENKRILFT